jgi:hypothetical protein
MKTVKADIATGLKSASVGFPVTGSPRPLSGISPNEACPGVTDGPITESIGRVASRCLCMAIRCAAAGQCDAQDRDRAPHRPGLRFTISTRGGHQLAVDGADGDRPRDRPSCCSPPRPVTLAWTSHRSWPGCAGPTLLLRDRRKRAAGRPAPSHPPAHRRDHELAGAEPSVGAVRRAIRPSWHLGKIAFNRTYFHTVPRDRV